MALHKPEHKTVRYWVLWLPLTIGFIITWCIACLVKGYDWTRDGWLRDWENYIDDPIDFVKEWLHCRKIPLINYQINISFLMNHRETTWDVIRKHGEYDNCDPEDKGDNMK